jgi:hypothetical protein
VESEEWRVKSGEWRVESEEWRVESEKEVQTTSLVVTLCVIINE